METHTEEIARILISIFGNNCWDDSAQRTAERWLAAMQEFKPEEDIDFEFTTFPSVVNQLIVVRDIEFSSICQHHLMPFIGKCHVGYIPNKKQVGLSKVPRLVHHFATRPQTQENLTAQVAKYLKDNLEAMGVAVVIQSTHTCMSTRGVREHNGVMVTSEVRGVFLTSAEARQEFLAAAGLT